MPMFHKPTGPTNMTGSFPDHIELVFGQPNLGELFSLLKNIMVCLKMHIIDYCTLKLIFLTINMAKKFFHNQVYPIIRAKANDEFNKAQWRLKEKY